MSVKTQSKQANISAIELCQKKLVKVSKNLNYKSLHSLNDEFNFGLIYFISDMVLALVNFQKWFLK